MNGGLRYRSAQPTVLARVGRNSDSVLRRMFAILAAQCPLVIAPYVGFRCGWDFSPYNIHSMLGFFAVQHPLYAYRVSDCNGSIFWLRHYFHEINFIYMNKAIWKIALREMLHRIL
ncbi:MAG: hypothetical protein NTV00_12075 [Methylococcales bacterium]|nr:hypothetical protein [Methylococcales bacterium]